MCNSPNYIHITHKCYKNCQKYCVLQLKQKKCPSICHKNITKITFQYEGILKINLP